MTVVVPMDVEAFVVGSDDAATECSNRPHADFTRAPFRTADGVFNRGPFTSDGVLGPSAPFGGATPLEKGVHLHWALPAALTRGRTDATEKPAGAATQARAESATSSMGMPNAPNRWLVTRILRKRSDPAGKDPELKSWVVESDRLSMTSPSAGVANYPTVPIQIRDGKRVVTNAAGVITDVKPDLGQPYRYIGAATPAETWKKSTSAERFANLSALGYGHPMFAAFYPDCRSVFGFHDTLDGITGDVVLTYHVAGWYSGADDPVKQELARHRDDPPAWLDAIELQWRWGLEGWRGNIEWYVPGRVGPGPRFHPYWRWKTSKDKVVLPSETLITGFVDGVAWSPKGAFVERDKAPLRAAIGRSAPEALSALLAADKPEDEVWLNALQFGVLAKLDQSPDALEVFEETMHRAGFAGLAAGEPHWELFEIDPPRQGKAPEKPVADDEIAELNDREERLAAQLRELESRRWALFSHWYKYLTVVYDGDHVPLGMRDKAADIRDYILAEAARIQALDAHCAETRKALDNAKIALEARLPLARGLRNAPNASFWRQRDPVVCVSSADAIPVSRTRREGVAATGGRLPVRTEDKLITSVRFAAGTLEAAAVDFDLSSLPGVKPPGGPSALVRAFSEVFSLAPSLQEYVCLRANGGQPPADRSASGKIAEELRTYLLGGPAGAGVASRTITAGVLPDPVVGKVWDKNPWIPLILEYELYHAPFASRVWDWPILDSDLPPTRPDDLAADLISARFHVSTKSLDAEPREGDGIAALGEVLASYSISIQGSTVLTPHARNDLARALDDVIDHGGLPEAQAKELEALREDVRTLPQLSQALSGVFEALLMRHLTLQLPVADPLAAPFDDLAAKVARCVGSSNISAPLPQLAFAPIACGVFKIARLRLVDAFGQSKLYEAPKTKVAIGLKPPAGLPAALKDTAYLAPRLTQPARLKVKWLPRPYVGTQADDGPSSSPVMGWVIQSFLDHSLFIYDESGEPVVQLKSAPDRSHVLLAPVPGAASGMAVPPTIVSRGPNDHLANFILGMSRDRSLFDRFMKDMEDVLNTSHPSAFKEDIATAVLMGRPLALVRAQFDLEVFGAPVADQSWASFHDQVTNPDALLGAAQRGRFGFDRVRIPAELGATHKSQDGVVAYWVDQPGAGAVDYLAFHIPKETVDENAIAFTVEAPGSTTRVTMLMEPHGIATLACGVLPVETLQLDPAHYSDSLKTLSVSFVVMPLVTPVGDGGVDPPVSVILPARTQAPWRWFDAADGAWRTEDAPTSATAEAKLETVSQQLIDGWLSSRPD